MAARGNRGGGVHTTRNPNRAGWVNQAGGRILTEHRLKARAADEGRRIAQERRAEHTVHNKDGRIAEKNSYGHDPRRSKG